MDAESRYKYTFCNFAQTITNALVIGINNCLIITPWACFGYEMGIARCKHTTQMQMETHEMENFPFSCVSFHTCEPEKRKRKREVKKNKQKKKHRFIIVVKRTWTAPACLTSLAFALDV